MRVSIVIPARNAAATLARTLESLLAQHHRDWEAIIVDDGSTDGTAEIVERHSRRDPRFRLVQEYGSGPALARNRGIEVARYEHLLFLDADDWLLPAHLQKLTEKFSADRLLDAAVCGWAHVTPAGEFVFEQRDGEYGDLFRAHAEYCYSLIHTYLLRRSLVEEAGGFDEGFRTCEDWDLFQRIARAGARFGRIPEVLAAYRMRPGSATADGLRILEDGLRVLRNGHGTDVRVGEPHPAYPEGLPPEGLPACAWGHACTCAGYLLGAGAEASPVIERMGDMPRARLSSVGVAQSIFVHTMVAAARPVAEWRFVWEDSKERRRRFLRDLARRLSQPGLVPAAEAVASALLHRHTGRPAVSTALWNSAATARRRSRSLRRGFRRGAIGLLRSAPSLERPYLRLKRWRAQHRRGSADDHDFEGLFRGDEDPWDVDNDYERMKTLQTLAFLPAGQVRDALEAGCAEGHMTERLASRVDRLVAADISGTALQRASRRCADHGNIEFRLADCLVDPPAGPFDLIVCSELLYYCRDRHALGEAARRLTDRLRPGGYLLLTHANRVGEEPDGAGFDWGQPFGAKIIGEAFAGIRGLESVREGRAPLYRVQLFRRGRVERRPPTPEPLEMADPLPAGIADQAVFDTTKRLPLLVYPGVGTGARSVSPALFDEHISALRSEGYRSIPLHEWRWYREYDIPIAGHAVHIVIDRPDGDGAAHLHGILEKQGYRATLMLDIEPDEDRLVVSADAGPSGWRAMRGLQAAGSDFGLRLPDAVWHHSRGQAELVRVLSRAREIALRELAAPVSTLRAPATLGWTWRYRWTAAAAGFRYAIGDRRAAAAYPDPLLALPSIKIEAGVSAAALLSGLRAGEAQGLA